MSRNTKYALEGITKSIRDAGYDPYTQMYGFLMTGNERFVTRTGKAREQIKRISRSDLASYLQVAV